MLVRALWAARLLGYRPTGPETLARQITRQHRGRIITVALLATMGALAFAGAELVDAPAVRFAGAWALLNAAIIAIVPLRGMHPAYFHVLPFLILGPWACGVATLAPDGGVVAAALVFIGPTIAFVIEGRAARAAHWAAASAVVIGLVVFADTDAGTDAALIAALGSAVGLAAFIRLVWKTAEEQASLLELLVRRDQLTGVGNRRLLSERLGYELARHARAGRPLTLVVLDLNGFKQVNDRLGHQAGDDLLRDVGAVLTASLRAQDTVARPGGDEFCVVAPETGPDDAGRLVAGIRGALAMLDAGGRPLTAAIGTATFPQDGADATTLTAVADARQREDKLRSSVGLADVAPPASFAPVALPAAAHVPLPSAEEDHVPLSRRVSRQKSVRVAVMLVYLFGALAAGFGAWALSVPDLLLAVPVALGVVLAMRFVPTDRIPAPWFHFGPVISGLVIAAGVAAAEPWGYMPMPLFVFTGAAIGFMMETRRAMALQTVLALGLIALSLVTSPAGDLTVVAVVATSVALVAMVLFIALPWRIVEEQAEELGRLMRRDPLTGVGNRRLLHERLDYELTRHGRTGRRFALIVLDLNGFKQINDTLGHQAGDEALQAAATALRSAVRRQDTVARQGGDEFAVLAAEAGAQEAALIARNIREALGEVDAGGRGLAGAVGFAIFPDDATDGEALLDVADARQRADKGWRPQREAGRRRLLLREAGADFRV